MRFQLYALFSSLLLISSACSSSPSSGGQTDAGGGSGAGGSGSSDASADSAAEAAGGTGGSKDSGADSAAGSDSGTSDAGKDAASDAGPTGPFAVVVIGSSTAEGKNLDQPSYGGRVGGLADRWSDCYERHLKGLDPASSVLNIAKAGYTSFSALPDGTSIASEWPPGNGAPDPLRNISYAVAQMPDAVIVNMPMNRELAAGVTIDTLMTNLHTMETTAKSAGISFWVATTAVPLGTAAAETTQIQAANARLSTEFGQHTLDFYAVLSPNGQPNTVDVLTDSSHHPSAAGHQKLCQVVIDADLPANP